MLAAYTVGPYGYRRWLKPHLRVTLTAERWRLLWFVEVDRGTEHRPVLRRKIAAYLTARRMGVEYREIGTFPRVLWVTPDKRRARVIEELCDERPDAPDGLFVATTAKAAVRLLPLA